MAAPEHPLFSWEELRDYLRTSVTPGQGEVAERVVWGWLKPILKQDARPEALSDELWGPALQLGGIAFSNPESLDAYSLGSERSVYSRENRDAILKNIADVLAGGIGAGDGPPRPRGKFPKARRYPDAAECW